MAHVGVESALGFGDALFNIPLIRAISERYQCKVGVAVMPHCADAFENIPWIDKILHIPAINHGTRVLRASGYDTIFQLTQNTKFLEFKDRDPNHSLIDTPLLTGRQLGLGDFDQKPIFLPTPAEMSVGARYDDGLPNIVVESMFTSGQSWATSEALELIINKYSKTHRICWCSNSGAPQTKYMDNMLRWTRREIITSFQHCQTMFSVGSGFFCAALALPKHLQPRRIVCLWIDGLYRYEKRITELRLHDNIVWVHSTNELLAAL